jgi:hypothetical protein
MFQASFSFSAMSSPAAYGEHSFSASPFLTHPGAVLREFESRCFPFFSVRASLLNPAVHILQVNASLGNLYRHWLQSSLTFLPCKCRSRNSYYSFHGGQALYLLLQSVHCKSRGVAATPKRCNITLIRCNADINTVRV